MQERTVNIEEIEQLLKENPNLEIETPDGWVKVNKFFNQGVKQTYKVTFKNGLEVVSTLDHKYQTNLGMIPLEAIREQHNILTKKGYTQIKSIAKEKLQNTYDIEVNHSNHRFYADDVAVKNCNAEGNLYTPDAIREYAEVEMSSTNVFTVIQTPEMKESKLLQVQHLISRENDLFKPTRLLVDPEVGLIKEIGNNGADSIDYVTDDTANEIVDIVSKNLFN